MDRGTYVEDDGQPAVRFQRTYPHPIERVWAAVSEPDELAHWFPSQVKLDPHVGGAIDFSGDPNLESSSGTILAFEPPCRLTFTWGGDELRFELEPVGTNECRLTLIDVLGERDTAARNASGWTVCLAELDKHLNGIVSRGPNSPDAQPFAELYAGYIADGMPSGAWIPEGVDS
jgi:uncharacterized protein YndB with AHSA1/START domain